MSALGAAAAARPALAQIDWGAPWLQPLRPYRHLAAADDLHAALSAAARGAHRVNAAGQPIGFVAADDAGAAAYESHIAATGRVPTRHHGAGALHDFFNALVWLDLPRSKAALNRVQATQIARHGIGPRRGPLRDAATLIDESGLLLACTDAGTERQLAAALQQHDWTQVFGTLRDAWHQRIVPRIVGHALLEKLVQPYKALTAAVILVRCDRPQQPEAVDQALTQFVERPDLAPPRLAHLPVLGVPGWWRANADPSFYDDPQVFRRPRAAAELGAPRTGAMA